LFAKQLKPCGVHRHRATRLFNNNNNNNNNMTQATRFMRQSEFPPWFFGSSRYYFRDKKFTFMDFLERQTKVKGKADPVHIMKECEGMEV
jgi:hypothetical protein